VRYWLFARQLWASASVNDRPYCGYSALTVASGDARTKHGCTAIGLVADYRHRPGGEAMSAARQLPLC